MARNTALLDKTVLSRYLALPQPDDRCQCMYIWIDGTGEHVRCKTKTVDFTPHRVEGIDNVVSVFTLLAYRTDARSYWHHTVVYLSVCLSDAVHYNAQGLCMGVESCTSCP